MAKEKHPARPKAATGIVGAIITGVCYAIPRIPNFLMLSFLQLCTLVRVPRRRREKNALLRSRELAQLQPFATAGYVEAQPCWSRIPFGLANMAYSGCEILAVYNALYALGNKMTPPDMAELISAFERRGAVLLGLWGCSPRALSACFTKCGYETSCTCSKDPGQIDRIGEESDTVLLTAYNNRNDIRCMIHTICVTKDYNGCYIMHNVYHRNRLGEYTACGGHGRLQSLSQLLPFLSHGGHAAPIFVLGIRNPQS